jgi:chromate transporter
MASRKAMTEPQSPTLAEATRVWAKIGLLSFGGPAGQIALMHRELVEERRWIGEQRFLHALNYCMLLPGPEAQQLAVYIGWLMHRTAGGLIAGILFVLPGALVMLALSILYAIYRHVPFVDAIFIGVKSAVLAIVIEALLRIGRRALKTRASVLIAAAAFLAINLLKVPFPLIIVAAGLAGWLIGRAPKAAESAAIPTDQPQAVVDRMIDEGGLTHIQPSARRTLSTLAIWLPIWLAPVAVLWLATGDGSVWTRIGSFFSVMAVVTFGGAYAVLAYVAQAAVENFGWLAPGEMVDGLGLAETTPGPLIMVLQFVGFLAAYRDPGSLAPIVAGTLGALLTTWVTFAPCFLWIFAGAPYVEKLRGNAAISAALGAITAAVVGVILNLAVWFALHVLFAQVTPMQWGWLHLDAPVLASVDWRALVLAIAAMIAMFRLHIGMVPTLAGCAIGGLLLSAFG